MRDIATQHFPHVDAFRAGIQTICGAYHVEPSRTGFAARAGLASCGGLELASVALAVQSVQRDRRAIRSDDADHFVLTLQQKGRARMVQEDQSTVLRPGDMFLFDASRPSTFDFREGPVEQLSVHLPRPEVMSRFGALTHCGYSIRREDSLAVAMTALLQRAQGEAPPEIGEAFFALLGAWLQDAARGGATPRVIGDGLLGQALTLINLHYRDPDFGPGALAELLNVAPRRLQRAFASLGETPRERILATRLEQARRVLSQRAGRKIVDVAFDQGFGDLSHFYQAYRARFGHAPGATGRPGADGDTPSANDA